MYRWRVHAAAARATELDPGNRDYREWRATLEKSE